jgi:hypothetical protein
LAISSSIINDIERTCATGLTSLAYYYFDFKDTEKQNLHGLLSSLLTQLCTWSYRGYDILSSLYVDRAHGLRQTSEADLIKCLKKVLALPYQGRVYVIMDALDECPDNPGIPFPCENVLQLVKELVDLHHPDLRVCITSRLEVDILMVLKPLVSHTVSLHDERGQKDDIISYVKSAVETDDNIRKWREADKQLAIDLLPQKANGS